MPAPINLNNFRLVKTNNPDVERNYTNDILHALAAKDNELAASIAAIGQGVQGPTGPAGADGAPGPAGPTGATGATGPAGNAYFRRDDLVAVGGENGIALSQTPLDYTVSVVRVRSGVSYELLGSDFTLAGTTISLSIGINAADVCIVRYASATPITVASDYTSAITWNPSDKSSNVTLSAGNLVYTHTGPSGNGAVCRATVGKSTGLWYWEVVLTNHGLGTSATPAAVAAALATLTNYIGSDAYGWSYLDVNGSIYHNGIGTSFGFTYTTGDILGIALNMNTGNVWFSKNGVWQGFGTPDPGAGTDPAFSGLTGTIFPACNAYDNGAQMTARFSPSSWSYTAPTGFSALTP